MASFKSKMKGLTVKNLPLENSCVNSSGIGYISEKLYILIQIYLQNKQWNPTIELLQCFSELKESNSMVPSPAHLQMMANRITLDNQGRLVLRENAKIILPFEHFANAVMLKHMNGPHGLHMSIDATIRAVMDSYTVGRENFGMEKEFIIEVVQNCPNPTCRFYKTQMDQLSHKQHLSSDTAGHQQQTQQQSQSQSQQQQQQQQQQQAQPQQHTGGNFQSPETSNVTTSSGADLTDRITTTSAPSTARNNTTTTTTTTIANLPPPAPSGQTENNDQADKLADFLRTNFETIDGAKDFLALQNGVWPMFETDKKPIIFEGQDKVIRTYAEIMKNMTRMKTCVRPSMCKPYGKQSEALQKTLIDTIQLVQSLRSFLPPPHVTVTSWKEEEHKHRPGSKSSLRTIGKPSGSDGAGTPLPQIIAENLQHLVRPKIKYENV